MLEKIDSSSTRIRIACATILTQEGGTNAVGASKLNASPSMLTAQGWARAIAKALGIDNALLENVFAKDIPLTAAMNNLSSEYRASSGTKGLGKTILKVTFIVVGCMAILIALGIAFLMPH